MGWGKILTGVTIGVGAVAAAPFTGGGSILGAATALGSLAGAGTIAGAVGAGAVGAAVGSAMSDKEEQEKTAQKRKVAEVSKKADKFETIASEHQEHTNLILALSALGISMANADGHISEEEREELNEFVGGITSAKYPTHIVEQIDDFVSKPPSLNTALSYLGKVDAIEYPEIRNLLVMVMEADDDIAIEEKAFLVAFDEKVEELTSV